MRLIIVVLASFRCSAMPGDEIVAGDRLFGSSGCSGLPSDESSAGAALVIASGFFGCAGIIWPEGVARGDGRVGGGFLRSFGCAEPLCPTGAVAGADNLFALVVVFGSL